ncbi:GL26685 [Drosophila persimilis]|uniref:Uncharacterized protein OS9 n=2 Tax=pseudoobscura subgroup TaxID=32358 RepID=Q29KJ9_DROPS|nr:uncharacterized protein LOC4816767 [Drosophila pseudoobscura]XP_002021758.1 uncharacterized protein LOC6596463 [Drosophila persimilis]EDW25601.1 GL26685 [Drosophila persimilis]
MWRPIIVLAALQFASGAPITSSTQLAYYMTNEIVSMVETSFLETARLLQRVIDDAELFMPPNTQSLILDAFGEFVDLVKEIDMDDSVQLELLATDLDYLSDIFELKDSAELDSEADRMVMRLLQEHGIDDFESSLLKRFDTALKRIEEQVESYISGMSPSKLQRRTEFLDWFDKFKNEKDTIDKLSMLFDSDYLF